RPLRARRLARAGHRHAARVLPGPAAAAGRHRLPRRGAPGHPVGRDRADRPHVDRRRRAGRARRGDCRDDRLGRRDARARRMEDAHARDLTHAPRGRGYAQRVSSALRAWVRNPPTRVVDVLVFALVGLPTVGTAIDSGARQGRLGWGILFGLGTTLPLLIRRRWPFAALALMLAAAVPANVDVPFPLPLMVALYTIGAHRSWEATVAA